MRERDRGRDRERDRRERWRATDKKETREEIEGDLRQWDECRKTEGGTESGWLCTHAEPCLVLV